MEAQSRHRSEVRPSSVELFERKVLSLCQGNPGDSDPGACAYYFQTRLRIAFTRGTTFYAHDERVRWVYVSSYDHTLTAYRPYRGQMPGCRLIE